PLPAPSQDSDEDTIPDIVEGWILNVDSDGDGDPDYEDRDSDGDSILDSIEAGDSDMLTPPIDTDGDGTPDYLDDDSDGNGLLDRVEGAGDADGDGLPDFADVDDDEDRIPDVEEIGDGAFPVDSDGDGFADFRDFDSDGDSISDRDEYSIDTDGDGTRDYLDLDSDGDGLPDALEAGDATLETPPVDTDLDAIPDYRDLDSDNDGLSDALELASGSSAVLEDTDGDGVSDLVEVGAGSDPANMDDNPQTRGDFVFIMPYREAPFPERDTLLFRTNIRRADVYFLFDTTGSMSGEITTMRDRVTQVIDNITCEDSRTPCAGDLGCVGGEICSLDGFCMEDPVTSGCIADLWTGVGTYAGYEDSYRNILSLQPDIAVTQAAIPERADGPGGAESLYESAACVADPSVCFGAVCDPTGIGCPAYRRDAIRILAHITDETNQCTTEDCQLVNTSGAAGGRLALQRINFLAIDADSGQSPRNDLRNLGIAAGTVDSAGEPFYYAGSESAVAGAVTTGISEIASELKLFVDIDATDADGDDGDALQFIQRVEINTSAFGCTDAPPFADVNGDGFDDAFPDLKTRTPVCWDVIARPNTRVPSTDRPQVFVADLTVYGDGSPLDRRRVFFLVPPRSVAACPDPPCE
ncbi:MAG: hypothetical protein JRH11_23050, partial [Deltaproteobacteria bacterium]|nr:hypothetical protein [Deltaproteobacteria bacterium]